jgi:hypothetical protein
VKNCQSIQQESQEQILPSGRIILPIGPKSNQFGKWSPNWEAPYKVIKVIFGNSYMLETLQGEHLTRAINRRYLKKYFPSVWQEA